MAIGSDGEASEDARPVDDPVHGDRAKRVLPWTHAWPLLKQVWRGRGLKGWQGGTHDEEQIWLECEAKLITALGAEFIARNSIFIGDLPIPYIACISYQCERQVHRAFDVLADETKAGIFVRHKGPNEGRKKTTGYTWRVDRFLAWDGKRRKDRPALWVARDRVTRSDTAMPHPRADRVEALRQSLGLPPSDPDVQRLLELAKTIDRRAVRREKTAQNLIKREEADQRLETELETELGKLAARPPQELVARSVTAHQADGGDGETVVLAGTLRALREIAMRRDRDPDADLIEVLCRAAEADNEWAISTAENVLQRGGALSERQKQTLRKMRDEQAGEAQGRGARGRAAPAPNQGLGNWGELKRAAKGRTE